MNRIANANARRYVEWGLPFKGSNLFAEYKGPVYVVYSYGYHWPLLAYINGEWYTNKDKYSRSTSRHFSQVVPCGALTHSLTKEGLEDYIKKFGGAV